MHESLIVDTVDGPFMALDYCHREVARLAGVGIAAAVVRNTRTGYACVVRLDGVDGVPV